MIKLFGINDTLFSSNGDKVIIPLRAKVHKEDNGSFYLDFECSLDYINDIVAGNILVVPTPQGEQAFRISSATATRSKITAKCYHIFYDSKNYLIEDSYVVDKNCNDALDHLNSATSDLSPFTTLSDVNSTNSFRCVRKSLYEAINVVLERWGGHLVRDNFNIKIKNEIGQDNGVVVRYGKNLKNITCQTNWENVVTKLMPVGKDGLLLNKLDQSADVYVTSDIQYDIPFTKTVSFEQNINEEDYQDDNGNLDEEEYTQALLNDLYNQAINYVNTNDIPKVNYTLKANLEKITDIGDTVEVIDERLGINITTNVISYVYDCILEKYTEIEFGNFTQKLDGLINSITSNTQMAIEESNQSLQVTLGQELQQAQDRIWNALGSSYVIYEGDKILVVDTLPKESATNVIMINNGGIAFSNTGINGTFSSAWTIDNVLNMEQINVINLTANLIKGGTLKLGSNLNQNGQLEVYDETNNLIAELNKNGLKMYGVDGSYVLINNTVGFAGYDRNNNLIYWVNGDEFHQKKSVVEEEITLCNKLRFIPITIYDGNTIVNDGIGLVSVAGGN
ncbi:MAG: phage tail protein [Methanobrevibacter sp.]|nr:phage tail protein [Bacilli bacterium]MBQ3415276.1 phage tail protein [Clostridia bacterium]MBR0058180.1 phage tail protein [Methanobrevibacter sp.]MBR0371608.1 phage tail protein [Methanobrevibacter sp.]